MKRPILFSLICFSAITLYAPLALAQNPDKPAPPATVAPVAKPSIPHHNYNILELTNAEMYRYGRELYLSGNFTEAARVFLRMLRNDCTNKVAQYHLRKIAARVPALAFLNEKLDKLPCRSYDFSKEDFLPASVYYEKDPGLMLEQLISYSSRHRLTEKEMSEKIDQYSDMVRQLEAAVKLLKADETKAKAMTSAGVVGQETLDRIEDGKKSANKIEKEIGFLKNQLASERLDRQKEVQDMRTRVAEAEARLADQATVNKTPPSTPSTAEPPAATPPTAEPPAYSENAKALLDAVAQAKVELEGKERSLAEKDKALSTLQARFDDIQRRLQAIQADLAHKNTEIEALQNNLQDTPKP